MMLPMTITVVSAIIYHTEYVSGGLRYTLSLPVGKVRLYLSKWCTTAAFVGLLLLCDTLMLAITGMAFHLPGENNSLALEGGIFFAVTFLLVGLFCFSKKRCDWIMR